MIDLNLKPKFAILTGTLILSVSLILTVVLTRSQESTIRGELLNRAVALTENLAYNCQLPLAAENQTSLRRLAQGLFKQTEASYVEFLSTDGRSLHRAGNGPGWTLEIVAERDVQVHRSGTRTAWYTTRGGQNFLDVRTSVRVEASQEDDILATQRRTADVDLGTVRVGFSAAPAQALIAHVRVLGGMLGLAIALAGSLVAAALIHVMTRPLAQLMEGNRRVARGDYGLRLEVRTRDEFGRLAGSYNQMTDEIQRSHELAESYLASLRANAEHLEEANRALQQSNTGLAKASRMKSEFLAVMSHELRTPLNVILGFSEVLLDQTSGPLNPKQSRYAENILSSGKHLLDLINGILDLSKVEAGRMKVSVEPFDLRQAFDEIGSLVRDLARKREVQFACAAVPTLTPVTDQKLFKQVVLNLVANAIKFTPAGGQVDLAVRCLDGRALRSDSVTRLLSPERRLAIMPRRVLLVEVRDTGVGIPTEEHDKIFHAFQQVDASYARRHEGTGLGLALSRKLVQLLGGDIWFRSAAGEGSIFWFYVPFEMRGEETPVPESKEATPAEVTQPAAASRPHASPRHPERSGGAAPAGPVDLAWPWGEPAGDVATSAPLAASSIASPATPSIAEEP
jgi:signal transduction histidine kinase